MPVTASAFTVRRATIEDQPGLAELWEAMKYPSRDLEKRLTEFQIAVGEELSRGPDAEKSAQRP